MKTVEEKLQFKNHFAKLGQGRVLALDDKSFWSIFWQLPDSANDIFEVLTAFDIKTIRDQSRVNFFSLVYVLVQNVVAYSDSSRGFNITHALNCLRLLTRLLPFLYELSDYKEIEHTLFLKSTYDPLAFAQSVPWASDTHKQHCGTPDNRSDSIEETVEPKTIIADRLIKALMKLLYFRGFTISPSKGSESMVYYSVWEPGIGVSAKYQVPDLVIEANRTEVLKLLITLCGGSLYQSPSNVVANGSTFLTLLVAAVPRVEILTLVCSLINVLCRASRNSPDENFLHLNDPNLKFSRTLYIQYCMLLLTLMIVYPLPPKGNLVPLRELGLVPEKAYNTARLYFGKLHKDQEILFLASSLVSSLKTIIGTNNGESDSNFNLNLRMGVPAPPVWAMESVMILWELFQCNNKFKQVAGKKFYAEICFILVFYIKQFQASANDKNMVKLVSYFLLYLTHQPNDILEEILVVNPEFSGYLPSSVNFHPQNQYISSRDYMVIQICGILSNYGARKPLGAGSPLAITLVEILYNILPLVSTGQSNGTDDPSKKLYNTNPRGGLSYIACTSITNLIVRFSNREFLLRESFHSDLLALLIRGVCIASLRDAGASRTLLFSILKSEKIYDQTWNTIYSFKNEYFDNDMLVLKAIQDIDEESTPNADEAATQPNSVTTTNGNTPLNGSTTNLTINDENDPKSPPATDIDPVSSGDHMNHLDTEIEDENTDFDAETKAIEKALRPSPPTGMTPKAKGKQKMEAPIYKTWGGNDALRIILTIIIPHLKLTLNEIWSSETSSTVDAFELVKHIGESNFEDIIQSNESSINYDFLPSSSLVPLKFTWSSLSLGWYISLLFSDVYNSIDNVDNATGGKNKIINNLTASVMSFGRFFQGKNLVSATTLETPETIAEIESRITKINPWASTNIKLFKLKSESNRFFDVLNSKLTSTVQSQALPSTPNLNHDSLSRRLSGLRLNQIRSESVGSGLSTPKEEQEPFFPRMTRGSSVSSFQSLNTMNRSRTNTPRNSISEY